MNEKLLQEAAKWIWDRKDDAQYWNYSVLTSINPDTTSLKLNQNAAFQIFIILKDRNLILPTIVTINNTTFPAFNVNYNKEKEWKSLSTKKGLLNLYIFPLSLFFIKKFWSIVLAVIIVIFNSSISSYIQIIFEKLFKP